MRENARGLMRAQAENPAAKRQRSIACQSRLFQHIREKSPASPREGTGKGWNEVFKGERTTLALTGSAAAGSLLGTRCSCRLGGLAGSGRAVALTLCEEAKDG